ncbi:hypothetical protein L596_021479 [Steinernema carpocapsae]|uniref:Uncharacterized protein n=1 Tax=Steinernema carpocapsae TaxID=34508 RepID=A0A4U5MJP6_STECR|nr:hypothetical protein L596_021479 [Steinernema carpocapsae]
MQVVNPGFCQSKETWAILANNAFNHVGLPKKQVLVFKSALANDMPELIDPSFPTFRQLNFFLNGLQARQLNELQERIESNPKAAILAHTLISRAVASHLEVYPGSVHQQTGLQSSQYTELYSALTRPDIRIMVQNYGKGLFDVLAVKRLVLKRFQETVCLDADTIKELEVVFQLVIQMVMDQKATKCDRLSNRVPLIYAMAYNELENRSKLFESAYYPPEVFMDVVTLVNALEDMMCF